MSLGTRTILSLAALSSIATGPQTCAGPVEQALITHYC